MKSLRLDDNMEQRLALTAGRLGLTESDVIRRALDHYCDPAPGESAAEALAEYIGAFEGSGEAVGRNAHQLYGEVLHQATARKPRRELAMIAERKARYHDEAE